VSPEQLYRQYKPKLLKVCRQYADKDSEAEDLLHDAFVIILTSLDQVKDSDRLEAWMTSIVRRVGYHYREHQLKELATLRQMPRENLSDDEPAEIPDYDQIQSLVAQLPEGYQQVFRLSVFEGLTHLEISQLLGITPHASSSQLFRARQMLRLLIRRSWVLILLLIAVPAAVWKLLQEDKPVVEGDNHPQPHEMQIPDAQQQRIPNLQSSSLQLGDPLQRASRSIPLPEPVYASADTAQAQPVVPYQAGTPNQPDSIPYHHIEAVPYEPYDMPDIKSASSPSWNISLAYSGLMGQNDDYLAGTTISRGSFNAVSNTPIPAEQAFDNWAGYNDYLSNSPLVADDAETRSLMNIAAQNSVINGGKMEARHEHQLPVTIQLMFSRQLSPRLSIEAGLSYTQMKSKTMTGSADAYVLEQQRLRYLGLPFRLGYKYFGTARFSLYASAGIMFELPIHGTLDVQHFYSGDATFRNKSALSVPCQWSTSLGTGAQFNLTPHLGIYLEPSLQYFIPDGSDIQSYRTEHPLQLTLPFGIRFHW
jgi:RNA polymerase sigma-70 factor (ECF subfamily)